MQTCQKWNSILTVMIKDRLKQNVKVLIITGKPDENGAKIEVIDLIDPKWKHVGAFRVQENPGLQLSQTSGSTGDIYNNKVIICGGTSGWRLVFTLKYDFINFVMFTITYICIAIGTRIIFFMPNLF